MTRRPRQVLCHDCSVVLTGDDRLHYVYQCHDCAMLDHDASLAAKRDPDHPDAERLSRSAVDLSPAAPQPRTAAPILDRSAA